MFTHIRTQGIVLSKKNRGEADQLFTLYTSDFGKIEVLGKSIRKTASKLRGGIELLSFSEIEFIEGKRHKTLTDAFFLERFLVAKKDLRKFYLMQRMAEVFFALVLEQESDKIIWNLLLKSLIDFEHKNSKTREDEKLYLYFFW